MAGDTVEAVEILRQVEAFLRSGEAWFRQSVERWRAYEPDVDEHGGESIRFADAKQIDKFLENLRRARAALAVVIAGETGAEAEGGARDA